MNYISLILVCVAALALFFWKARLGFLLFVFFSPFDNFLFWDVLGFKVKIYQVFLLAGLLTFLLQNLLSKARIKKDPLVPLLLVYWAVGFISLSRATNATDAFVILVIELMSIAAYFLVVQSARTGDLLLKSLQAMIISANFIAVLSVFQVVGYNLGLKTRVIQTDQYSWGRPVGTFFESNYLGAFALSITLIILSLLTSKAVVINRTYLRVSLLLQLTGLGLSVTRGAWVGLAVGLLLLPWLLVLTGEKKWGARVLSTASLAAIMVLLASAVLFLFLPSVPREIWGRVGSIGSLNLDTRSYSTESVRLSKMQAAMQFIKKSPWIGYGPGQGGELYKEFYWYDPDQSYSRRGAGAANLFLSVTFQRGLLGLVIFVPFLGALLTRTVAAMKRPEDVRIQAILKSVFLGVCGLLFTFMFSEAHLLAFFWVMLGLLTAAQNAGGSARAQALAPEAPR